jgi:hypothetical protein
VGFEVEDLLGKRYVTDMRVMAVGARREGQGDDDRTVRLVVGGDTCEISLGELKALIVSGVVYEAGEVPVRGLRSH